MPAAKKTGRRRDCPECGREVGPTNIARHLRDQHGIAGIREWRRLQASAASSNGNGKAPATVRGTFRELSGFTILEDDQGRVWLAERIR